MFDYWGGFLSLIASIAIKEKWYIPYDLWSILYNLLFYIVGWYSQSVKKLDSEKLKSLVLPFLVLVLIYCLFQQYIANFVIVKISVAFLGIYFIQGLSWYVIKMPVLCKALSYIGSHTMTIYIWHVSAFKIVEKMLSGLFNIKMTIGWHGCYEMQSFYWVIFYSLIGVMVPLYVHIFIKNIKK